MSTWPAGGAGARDGSRRSPTVVYHSVGPLEETVFPHVSLTQPLPPNQVHAPHIRDLLRALRALAKTGSASYLRLVTGSRRQAFEAAMIRVGNRHARTARHIITDDLYLLTTVTADGQIVRTLARWTLGKQSAHERTFFLASTWTSLRQSRKLLQFVGPDGVAVSAGVAMTVVFLPYGGPRLTAYVLGRQIPLSTGLTELLAGRLLLSPLPSASTTPTRVPVPSLTATVAPTPHIIAIFHAYDSQVWHPFSVGIAPGEAVAWENDDTSSAHPVECVQDQSTGACPWTEKKLPAAYRDASDTLTPSVSSVSFPRVGTFTFRDALHRAMIGRVLVVAAPPGRKRAEQERNSRPALQ